jgi:hypothetical protein
MGNPQGLARWLLRNVVKSGIAKSTDTPTGRQGFGINEYTHRVRFKAVALKAGIYWQNVTPQCFKSNVCSNARYFESSEDDEPKPLNHVGTRNLLDQEIWKSTTFGLTVLTRTIRSIGVSSSSPPAFWDTGTELMLAILAIIDRGCKHNGNDGWRNIPIAILWPVVG